MDKSNGVGWVCINRPRLKMASESGSGYIWINASSGLEDIIQAHS